MTRRQTLALYALGATLLLAGCTPRVKPQPPTTPPKPVETGRPSAPIGTKLQRVENGRFTIPWVGAIACWPPDDANGKPPASFMAEGKSIPYYWPGFSCEWSDLVKGKGFNSVLYRFGTTPPSEVCCGLPGTEFAPETLALMHKGYRRATENDQMILTSVGWDAWRWKHRNQRDPVDIVGPAAELDAGMVVPLGPGLTKHVHDVVLETCLYVNVAYEISNESSLGPGWTPAWERAMYAEIRKAEQQPGCDGRVIHVIGSNTDDTDGPYDFLIYHDPNIPAIPLQGKPVMVNEYNPHLTVAALKVKIAEFTAAGQSFWYWRSDGDDDTLRASLNVLTGGDVNECPAPLPDRSTLTFSINCDALYGGSCDATPIVTRSCEYCASIGMGQMEPGGPPRCSCPMRNEGDPNRLVCEQYAMQAPAPVWTSDGAITLVDAYGFRVRTTGTWVRACDATGDHCAQRDVPK